MLRVAHVVLSYHSAPALGGPDQSVYQLCTALGRLGVEIDVYATNLATKSSIIQPTSFEREVEGVHASYLATKKLIPLGRNSFGMYYIPELAPRLRSAIRRYDIVHLHGYRDYHTLVGHCAAQSANVPYILNPRGTLPFSGHSRLAKRVFDLTVGKRILRSASGFVALSDREAQDFEDLGVSRSRLQVIHNGLIPEHYPTGVSGSAFRKLHGIHERFVILYFGRIHVAKGIGHMLRAAAQLRREGIDVAGVVVGGDEGYASTLRGIADDERFQPLYILPYVSGVEKLEVFGAADILVYATQWEGFGVSAFEGILSGIPTVVSAGTGCGEIVARLDAGTIVPYGDVQALSQVLRGMLEHLEEERAKTLAARPRVVAALDWGAIANQHCSVYASLVRPSVRDRSR